MKEFKSPFRDLNPPLTTEEKEALKSDIETRGVMHPVIVDEDGNILDGHNRADIDPNAPRKVVKGLTEAEKKAFVFRSNNVRRNISPEQRKERRKAMKKIAESLRKEDPKKWTQEAIGRELGVSHVTVHNWFTATNLRGEISCDARVKLSKGQKQAVFERVESGETQEQVAADYGVTRQAVSKIAKQERQRAEKEAAKSLQIEDCQSDRETEVLPGEWWQLGRHMLYCGDTSQAAFINGVPTNVALAFADPPYGACVDTFDDSKFYWQHDWLIGHANIVAVTPGIVSIFEFANLTEMPYKWSHATWIKNGAARGALGFGNWIYTAIFSNRDSIHHNSQDFLQVTLSPKENDDTAHRGRKPSQYIGAIIDLFTGVDDTVIDPFLGSGQTLLACEKLGRVCIGGEIMPGHCQAIIARWESIANEKAVKL